MKRCPRAKINLYLRILGKRPDGFHELETLMCPVDWSDELTLKPTSGRIELTVTGADLPAGPENLVYRAAERLQEHVGTAQGAHLTLTKHLPHGAGLGGGSADAAETLLGLNELWDLDLEISELAMIAAELGSDVPFFLYQQPAICRGRGEQITPCTLAGDWWIVLIHPGFGVATPWAYQAYAGNPRPGTAGELSWTARSGDESTTFFMQNDLEPPVFAKYLWINQAKTWLLAQDESMDALMSGSGSTVLAVCADDCQAQALADRCRNHFGEAAIVRAARMVTGN